jgi:hypothetical protein
MINLSMDVPCIGRNCLLKEQETKLMALCLSIILYALNLLKFSLSPFHNIHDDSNWYDIWVC